MNRNRGTRILRFFGCAIVLCLMVVGAGEGAALWHRRWMRSIMTVRVGLYALEEFIEAEGRWPRDRDELYRVRGGDNVASRFRSLLEGAKIRFDVNLETIDPRDLGRLRVIVAVPQWHSDSHYKGQLESLREAIEAQRHRRRGELPATDATIAPNRQDVRP